jgi:type I restriction enzyme, S subunit
MSEMKGWKIRRLDQIGEICSGSTPSTTNPTYWGGDIVWVTPYDLSKLNTPYLNTSGKKITDKGLKGCSAQLLPPGSIIISSRAPIGYIAIPTVECCTNQGCKSIKLKDEFDSEFVYYNIDFSVEKMKQLGEGTIFAEISKAALSNVEIAFPEEESEQSQIAAILSTIDKAIEQTEAIITKQQRIKTGLMQDLLTRGIDKNGNIRSEETHQFEDSPLGQIPVGWKVLSLEETIDEPITYGIVQAGPHIDGGVPYIRTGDMAGDFLELRGLLRTSRTLADSYKRSEVHVNDIVFALRATVGKVLPVPAALDGANLTQGTAKISPNIHTNPVFLLWSLRTSWVSRQIEVVQKGTTFSEITLGDLRNLRIAIPENRNEQDEIAHILEKQIKGIQKEKEHLAKLSHLKTALMQNLLTGKVRVTNLLDQQPAS